MAPATRDAFPARRAVPGLALLATAALAWFAASPAVAAPSALEAQQLGKQAYDYGFPLLEFLRVRREMTSVRCPDDQGNAPVNSFFHARRFADASARTVVAPNTDTLYSIAHLDLGKGPVVIRHPAMGKRYYSFELLDPYTNVIDIPGLREDGPKAGSYVIRWTGKPGNGGKPAGSPGDRLRVQAGMGDREDAGDRQQGPAQGSPLMTRYSLTLPNGRRADVREGLRARRAARVSDADRRPGLHRRPQPGALPRTRRRRATTRCSPSWLHWASGRGSRPRRPGSTRPSSLPSTRESPTRRRRCRAARGCAPTPARSGPRAGSCRRRTSATTGPTTRPERSSRWSGSARTRPEEAIYPAGLADPTGILYDGAYDYRLTFAPGEEPPAEYFWSLTMYDDDGYLVANPIDRYSLGPSHPPLLRRSDGSIVIAIQQTEPTEAGVNWLPSPPGGFRLNLRLYGPSEAAKAGEWRPPAVAKVGGPSLLGD